MSDKLDELWNQAHANPGVPVEIGRIVVCDLCDVEYTDLHDSGGFIYSSRAVCPVCEPQALRELEENEEKYLITAYCPAGVPFADFVRQQRGGNSQILVEILP